MKKTIICLLAVMSCQEKALPRVETTAELERDRPPTTQAGVALPEEHRTQEAKRVEQEINRPPKQGCPAWADLRACRSGEFVYAAGRAPMSNLGEAVAKKGARTALAHARGDDFVEESEIPAVATCADHVYALARAPVAKVGKAALAACDKPLDPPAPPAGCPDWTSKRVYREGDTVYGVNVVDPKLSPPLAQTRAENAARAEVMHYMRYSTSGQNAGTLSGQKGQDKVECGGATYVRLAFSMH